jgi:hypothetical protein
VTRSSFDRQKPAEHNSLDTSQYRPEAEKPEMHAMHVNTARAVMNARLGEAEQMRLGRQLTRAQRVSRKAEQAARQARMSLANAL